MTSSSGRNPGLLAAVLLSLLAFFLSGAVLNGCGEKHHPSPTERSEDHPIARASSLH